MIKRRFYRVEHSNRDDPSGSSSSSDDSDFEGDALDETEIEEDDDYEVEEEEDEDENIGSDDKEKGEASSSSSSGLPTSDDAMTAQDSMQIGGGNRLLATVEQSLKKDETLFDTTNVVLKRKSVFKCKLCPKILCLSEETLKTHLNSKGHARSEKLYKEGRLKFMLNEDGKIEAQTLSDDPVATAGSRQQSAKAKKKRKEPSKHLKESGQETNLGKTRPSKGKPEKRRKNDR